MTRTFNIKSPAKINIGLRVLSKRKDGYHNIETIFYPVKIYDEIKLKISKSDSNNNIKVNTTGIKNLSNEDNICYKAAQMFLRSFNIIGYGIEINIKKNIPIGAGLGGGSSDAASVLKILSKYFKKTDQTFKLKKIAIDLGSDVPFFLSAKPAYAGLRGEKLSPLPAFRILYKILIVNPGIHVSTKQAYSGLRIAEGGLRNKKQFNKIKKFTLNKTDNLTNDFEKVVFKKYPKIRGIKENMYEFGSVFSLMSGSGSTVYGFFRPEKIKAAEKFFRSPGNKVFIS